MEPHVDPPADEPPPDPELEQFLDEVRAARKGEARRTVSEPAPADAPAGYRVVRELHRGGQGVVHLAVQEATQREVALKILHGRAALDHRARRRFEREVELIAELRHPGIVTLYDSGATPDGNLYLAMELIEGEELDEHVARRRGQAGRRRGTELDEFLYLFLQIAAALEHAHRQRVVHRDLKPSNVLVDGNGVARLLDFGVAKLLEEEDGKGTQTHLTATGEFVGSIAWAAPEQIQGKGAIDARTDVYALGLVLYHMLSGAHPYPIGGSVSEVVESIVTRRPAPLKDHAGGLRVPRDLEAIVMRALEKEPDARYGSVAEVAQDVRRFLAGAPVAAREQTARYLAGRLVRRHPAAAALAVVVVAMGAFFAWQQEQRNVSLAHERSAARIAESRLLVEMDRAAEAEDKLWAELLEPPPGETRPVGRQPAAWALRELYARSPCVQTVDVGRGAISDAMGSSVLFQAVTDEGTKLQLRSLDDLSSVVAEIDVPADRCFSKLSADERHVAATLDDGRALVWDVQGSSGWVEGPSQPGQRVQFEDDRAVLSYGTDGVVWAWRVDEPDHRTKRFEQHFDSSGSVQIELSRDGKRMLLKVHTTVRGGLSQSVVLDTLDYRTVCSWTPKESTCSLSSDGAFAVEHSRSLFVQRLPLSQPGQPRGLAPVTLEYSETGAVRVRAACHPHDDVVAWSGGAGNVIRLHDLEGSHTTAVLSGHRELIESLAFSSDGRVLVSHDTSGAMKAWRVERSAKKLGGADVQRGTISELAFGSEGELLATVCDQPPVVAVWDVGSSALVGLLDGHEARVTGVDVHPMDPARVASTCGAGGVYLTNWEEASIARRIGEHDVEGLAVAEAVAFSPDGSELASIGAGELAIWSTDSGRELARIELPRISERPYTRYGSLAWDATGDWLALGQAERNAHLVWYRRSTGEVIVSEELIPFYARAIDYAPGLDRFAVASSGGRIRIYAPGAARPEHTLVASTSEIYGVGFSESNGLLAAGDRSGRVHVFELETFDFVFDFQAHETPVNHLAFAPDSGRLATACQWLRSAARSSYRDHAEVLMWDLFAGDACIGGNLERRAAAVTESLGRAPAALERVRSWALEIASPTTVSRPRDRDLREEKLRELERDQAELVRMKIATAEAESDPAARVQGLREVAQRYPESDAAHAALAAAAASTGDSVRSLSAWRRSTELAPRHATHHRCLGEALVLASEDASDPTEADELASEARVVLRTAATLDPTDAKTLELLGGLLLRMAVRNPGSIDVALLRQARQRYATAAQVAPEEPRPQLERARVELILGAAEDDPDAEVRVALWLRELVPVAEAAVAESRAALARGEAAEPWTGLLGLHDCLAYLGDAEGARKALDEALTALPSDRREDVLDRFLARHTALFDLDAVPFDALDYVEELLDEEFSR